MTVNPVYVIRYFCVYTIFVFRTAFFITPTDNPKQHWPPSCFLFNRQRPTGISFACVSLTIETPSTKHVGCHDVFVVVLFASELGHDGYLDFVKFSHWTCLLLFIHLSRAPPTDNSDVAGMQKCLICLCDRQANWFYVVCHDHVLLEMEQGNVRVERGCAILWVQMNCIDGHILFSFLENSPVILTKYNFYIGKLEMF